VKLSDTQLMILSATSRRPDQAAVLPANLKGSAAKKVVDTLVKEGLLQELRARDEMPVWRRGDDRRPLALRITKAGLKAIAADVPEQTPGEIDAVSNVPATGLAVQAARSKVPTKRQRPASKPTAKKSSTTAKTKAIKQAASGGVGRSKQDYVLAMLRRPEGATLDALVKATGWQQHSVRGFLAGTVRKKLKLSLVSEKIEGSGLTGSEQRNPQRPPARLRHVRPDLMSRQANDDAAFEAEIGRLPELSNRTRPLKTYDKILPGPERSRHR
jgi:hypothetical protein